MLTKVWKYGAWQQFLLQSRHPPPQLLVKVYDPNQGVHVWAGGNVAENRKEF